MIYSIDKLFEWSMDLNKKFKLEGILVAFCVVEEADRDVEAALSLRICAPYFL